MEIMMDDYGVLKVENTTTGSFDYPIFIDGTVYYERPEIWSEEFKSKVKRGLSRKSEKMLEAAWSPDADAYVAPIPLQYSKYKSRTPEPKTSVKLGDIEEAEVEALVPKHLR